MKIQVICQECGKKLTEIFKDIILNEDLSMYEKIISCETDGKNSYTYDEETGELLDSVIKIKSFKMLE